MSELSVMPVVCWEEWTAIFMTLFKKRSGFQDDIVNKQTYEKGVDHLKATLLRDKYKNSLSLTYTVDFLQHYSRVHANVSSNNVSNELINQVGLDIVRFSSQMADMCQKKNVKSISAALEQIGMEEFEFISEVRHALTHKQIPSLLMVKKSLSYLLEFLYEKYWLEQYTQLVKSDLIDAFALQKYLHIILKDENQVNSLTGVFKLLTTSNKKMSNIIADNVQTFRRRLNDISLIFIKNYDGENDLIQIDNLKKKKTHFSYFLSELLRITLKYSFYSRFQYTKEDRELILNQVVAILKDITSDSEFKKVFNKVQNISFLEYKFLRISQLSTHYAELNALCKSLELLRGKEFQKENEDVNTLNGVQNQNVNLENSHPIHSLELNKFGAFTLNSNQLPSLLGKMAIQNLK